MKQVLQTLSVLAAVLLLSGCGRTQTAFEGFGPNRQKLRVVNRKIATIPDRDGAVRLSDAPGNGVAWVEATDFRSGTIELEVRGQETLSQSFVGIAFHRADDDTYEAVYVRPFNFRSTDAVRKQHAVQYISLPQFDWPRLRQEFPEEFENPVEAANVPTDWVKLRVVVEGGRVQIYVGPAGVKDPAHYRAALEVRRLGKLDGGQVGLWVGNESGGDFANLVVTPVK